MPNPLPERFPVRVLRRRWKKEWRHTDASDGRGYVEVGEDGVTAGGVYTMDADRTVKLYRVTGAAGLIEALPADACKIWLWLLLHLTPGQDTVRVSGKEGMRVLGCRSHRPVRAAIQALMEYGLLAPALRRSHYYVNPYFAFAGNRLAYLSGFDNSTVLVYNQQAE